jgi:hypothetical protein
LRREYWGEFSVLRGRKKEDVEKLYSEELRTLYSSQNIIGIIILRRIVI